MTTVLEYRIDFKAMEFLRALAGGGIHEVMVKTKRRFMTEFCDLFEAQVRFNLQNADSMGHPPLSPRYLEYKKLSGLDTRMWQATGQLYESLRVVREDNGDFSIGWDSTAHEASKMTMADIAATLELGMADLNIPERPVMRPALEEALDKALPLVRRILRDEWARMVG